MSAIDAYCPQQRGQNQRLRSVPSSGMTTRWVPVAQACNVRWLRLAPSLRLPPESIATERSRDHARRYSKNQTTDSEAQIRRRGDANNLRGRSALRTRRSGRAPDARRPPRSLRSSILTAAGAETHGIRGDSHKRPTALRPGRGEPEAAPVLGCLNRRNISFLFNAPKKAKIGVFRPKEVLNRKDIEIQRSRRRRGCQGTSPCFQTTLAPPSLSPIFSR